MDKASEQTEHYLAIITDALTAIQQFDEFSYPLTQTIAQTVTDIENGLPVNIGHVQTTIHRSASYPLSFGPALQEIGLNVYEYDGKQGVSGPGGKISDVKIRIGVENPDIFIDFFTHLEMGKYGKNLSPLFDHFSTQIREDGYCVEFDFGKVKIEKIDPLPDGMRRLLTCSGRMKEIFDIEGRNRKYWEENPYQKFMEILEKQELGTLKEFVIISRYLQDPKLNHLYAAPRTIEDGWILTAWNRLTTVINYVVDEGLMERDPRLCSILYSFSSIMLDTLASDLKHSVVGELHSQIHGGQNYTGRAFSFGEPFGLLLFTRIIKWRQVVEKLKPTQ